MCGIAGIWNFKSQRPVEQSRLRHINDGIAHRGPDGEGYHLEGPLGLAHRRLSIIDLEGGRQPMCNEDGSIWIVFNGEIYNYPELRENLLQKGHRFANHCDTEAIVHLYEEMGERCCEMLRGMFAFAIWDSRKKTLLLARDRIGIKPLFFGIGKDGIAFGSELKCVRDSGLVDLQVELSAIDDLFTYFYIPGPKTIYRNIRSLAPGHCLVVKADEVKDIEYWDLSAEELHLPTEKDYEDQLHKLLQDSVTSHLLSDVPLGAFLSGGVDSSAVVALMSKSVSDPVMTCSIGFQEQEFNELDRARTVAQLFKTDHHEQVVTPEPAKILEKLAEFYDQPFPDDSAVPTYYVSRLAREQVKVVLSGDGGDENFVGYGRYPRHVFLQRLRKFLPNPVRSALFRPLAEWKDNRERHDFTTKLLRVGHQFSVGAREGYLHAMTIVDADLRRRIFSKELCEELRDYDSLDVFRDIYEKAPAADPIRRFLYLDLKTYLVDDILTKVDRASMANSLEVRVPILDHKVVEFAYALPLSFKLREGRGKYLLRRVMQRDIPASHLALKKKGFTTPMSVWLRGELKAWAADVLFGNAWNIPYLNQPAVEALWERFQGGAHHLTDTFNILVAFSLSCRLWSGGSSLANANRNFDQLVVGKS